MITVEHLVKKFGKVIALDHVSVNCKAEQSIALIGPNASGKTTLIKCILGTVIPDSGKILINNNNILHSWKYREKIGYMPQISRFPDNMTMKQVFDMIKDLRRNFKNRLDEELIESLELPTLMDKRMRTLSGGTRQKVSAALAFLFDPEILILDEPTAGLDPLSSEMLKEKIRKEKSRGKLVLITSHVLSDLDEIVTEVIYVQEGKVRFHKTINQLMLDTEEKKLSKAIAVVMQNS